MSSSSRRTAAVRTFVIGIVFLASEGTVLTAQQLAPARFESATSPSPAAHGSAPNPQLQPPSLQARAPLPRVALGTVLGGALGGAIGAAAGAGLGSIEGDSDGFVSAAEALGVIGLAVGYPVGAAIGARMGATVDGARPALGRLVVISALGAAAGGLVWNRVGEGFESAESMASWHMGAVAGLATHWVATSLAAQRAPAAPARPVRPAADPGRP